MLHKYSCWQKTLIQKRKHCFCLLQVGTQNCHLQNNTGLNSGLCQITAYAHQPCMCAGLCRKLRSCLQSAMSNAASFMRLLVPLRTGSRSRPTCQGTWAATMCIFALQAKDIWRVWIATVRLHKPWKIEISHHAQKITMLFVWCKIITFVCVISFKSWAYVHINASYRPDIVRNIQCSRTLNIVNVHISHVLKFPDLFTLDLPISIPSCVVHTDSFLHWQCIQIKYVSARRYVAVTICSIVCLLRICICLLHKCIYMCALVR